MPLKGLSVVGRYNLIFRKGRFGGEATAAYILKAARDPKIDAIVLRINSPGGCFP